MDIAPTVKPSKTATVVAFSASHTEESQITLASLGSSRSQSPKIVAHSAKIRQPCHSTIQFPSYWHGGLVGVFSLTAGTRICNLGCWLGLSELAGSCAGVGPPGVCSEAEAVVTTCCWMSFCCTTWAVAVTVGIICTCCPAAVACVSVTVCGEAWAKMRSQVTGEQPWQCCPSNRELSHLVTSAKQQRM